MKRLLLSMMLIIPFAGLVKAQDGCMEFFPTKQGATLVSKTYDAGDKLLNTTTYTVGKSENYAYGTDTEVGFTLADAQGKAIDKGTIDVSCQSGTLYTRLASRSGFTNITGELGSDVELVGSFLDYPNPFSFNNVDPFNNGFQIDEADYIVQSKTNKKDFLRAHLYNRNYVKTEKITTPAGEFDAAKVTFNYEVRQNKSSKNYKCIEWYAIGAGIVRSETYDNNHKLVSYTVLTSINK